MYVKASSHPEVIHRCPHHSLPTPSSVVFPEPWVEAGIDINGHSQLRSHRLRLSTLGQISVSVLLPIVKRVSLTEVDSDTHL